MIFQRVIALLGVNLVILNAGSAAADCDNLGPAEKFSIRELAGVGLGVTIKEISPEVGIRLLNELPSEVTFAKFDEGPVNNFELVIPTFVSDSGTLTSDGYCSALSKIVNR